MHDIVEGGAMPREFRFPPGKLPAEHLTRLLARYGARSRRVLTGPAVGEDAAAVLTAQPCLVVATDPVTCATDRLGWYAVHVNANDVATRGADPLWFLFTLLMAPADATATRFEEIFAQVDAACREVGAELIGGHTEITAGLDRPIAIGTMLGEVTTFRLTSTRGTQPGDAVVLLGSIAVEGTALLARDYAPLLRARGVPDAVVARARDLLDAPGISVLPAARLAGGLTRPHAMHDPTEGGLATALHEMAHAAQVGLEIDTDQVAVLPETRLIADALGLDPWGMLASGALLLSCDDDEVERLVRQCRQEGIPAARIGVARTAEHGVKRTDPTGNLCDFADFQTDEVVRATMLS